ncbi:biotin-dependent carboxyltransferase family protein [Thalassobius sp. Cn5-15]|uniref:5-oxoprolinase subunit C family protein n=1 Tax=Thalassobius sp. Cn5-15 TaxID=2917763 RepID=UPI001EF36A61|nr:biotin-dependent carboxyltransferase family protein [Thalassobius sp. Cn5-15]MCG7493259.1 biotin-dependent carboxyltransferase family protein [Thalassobius sp. Cn5-15]
MSGALHIHRAGPALSVQDLGRPGLMSQGIATGGAADRLALKEAAALLQAPCILPAIEMAGLGGSFTVTTPTRFALTGAVMQAILDGEPLGWNESHLLSPGQRLEVGGVLKGVYGYLTFAAPLDLPRWMGSVATQAGLGIGQMLTSGDSLPMQADPDAAAPTRRLAVPDRLSGGALRMMAGPQTALFAPETLERALATPFRRDAAANRQGVRLHHDGAPFPADDATALASDFICPGDVQMTGDGVPYVLMADCQTMGGYPRLGTVVAQDLPMLAQAPLGAELRLETITLEQADALTAAEAQTLPQLRAAAEVKLRDPYQIRDLLRYQLISGVTAGDDLDRD